MTRTYSTLLAATALSLTMGTIALAESHTSEPDCPEDMNTTAGCQLEGAEQSESGPIEGAATAPVAPGASASEDATTMETPGDADMSSEGDSATETTSGDGTATTEMSGDAGTPSDAAQQGTDASTEPDCPEDMNDDPGCQLEGAEQSEPGPVEGAATAPVAEGADSGEGSTTMETPSDSEVESETDGDTPSGDTESDSQSDASGAAAPADNITVAYEEDGRFFTAEDVPTFHVDEDGTVDWMTFSGFRRYHSECHVCHGPDGEGSSYAPAIKNSAVNMDYYDFYGVVVNGRQNGNSVMPHFGENLNVMCYLDDIYVYLKARGAGAVERGRPAKKMAKSESIQDIENACMGA